MRPEGQGDRQDPRLRPRAARSRRSTRTTRRPACKIAQNFTFARLQGGGGGATFTLNGIDTNGEFRRVKAFIHAHGRSRAASTARSRTTRRTSPARRSAAPSSRRTSRASRRSPSATGTGRARTRIWAYVPSHPARAPRERRLALRSRRAASTSSPTTSTATPARSSTTSGSWSARARSWRRCCSPTPFPMKPVERRARYIDRRRRT